jgi:hypothetical protein
VLLADDRSLKRVLSEEDSTRLLRYNYAGAWAALTCVQSLYDAVPWWQPMQLYMRLVD